MTAALRAIQTAPEDMALRVKTTTEPRQFSIQNNYEKLWDFDAEYVNISGYFGPHKPQMFAAAPHMMAAIRDFLYALDRGYLACKDDSAFIDDLRVSLVEAGAA